MKKFSAGFYRPSSEFRRLSEHVAVMDEDGMLIATVGSSDFHDREGFAESLAFAAVYAVAWDALALARAVAHSDHPLAAHADALGEKVPEALRGLASASPECSMFAFREAAMALIAKQLEQRAPEFCTDISDMQRVAQGEEDRERLVSAEVARLMAFYEARNLEDLVLQQAWHIERLQARLPGLKDEQPIKPRFA